MALLLLWILFGLGIFIQLIYLLPIFGKVAFFKSKPESNSENTEGVTVVIAAHNEFKNLKRLIPILFEQDYPNYDVLVINDRSRDRTGRLLEDLMSQYPKLRTVTVKYTPDHVTSKKYALTLGIKVAKNDVILLTDADCIPASDQWIRKMTQPVRNQNMTFSIGYAGYEQQKGFLNRWIQFETLKTALLYLSFAKWKSPFMGVGRNLCYRRSFFMEIKAFKDLWHLEGGDDDLLINRYATGKNTRAVLDADARTISIPKENWKDYFSQKKRHLNIGKHYLTQDKLKIGWYAFSHLLFWVGAIGLFIYLALEQKWEQIAIVFGIFLMRLLLLAWVFSKANRNLNGQKNPSNTLINDFLYLGYFWILGPISHQSKDIKWN
ncbi:glycosyltransferase [Algoriphagus sp. NF]|jgi:cellulose synthase/poly-beta-1,6-N-acetylglucosamine synthase-like glycosyltransferase|uniref:glycosyltransferase n=1 Tax=Algoriphagus sp. NF TaxID=2992756 RepID=UPI00106628A7|nr:glycosyltransferase [Algoriphagus sp. NF]MDE0561243.1 glycosyltransferase [Algoriphagus sp. NF]